MTRQQIAYDLLTRRLMCRVDGDQYDAVIGRSLYDILAEVIPSASLQECTALVDRVRSRFTPLQICDCFCGVSEDLLLELARAIAASSFPLTERYVL